MFIKKGVLKKTQTKETRRRDTTTKKEKKSIVVEFIVLTKTCEKTQI